MSVTEVVFDPRIDLPNGSLGIQAVTVRANPTRIREVGPSTVYPQTVTFTNVTGTTPLHLQSTDGTWAWTLGVYLRSKILDVRTVFVTGDITAWADLPDVDPRVFDAAPISATVADLIAGLQNQIDELRALLAGGGAGGATVIVESSTGGVLTLSGSGVTEISGTLTLNGTNVTESNGVITIS